MFEESLREKRGKSRNAFYPHRGGFSALITKHTNGNFFSPFLNMYPYKPWGDFVDPFFVSSVCPNISGVDRFFFSSVCPNICGMRWQQPFKAQPVLCPKFTTWPLVVAPMSANTSVRRKPERKKGGNHEMPFIPIEGGFLF